MPPIIPNEGSDPRRQNSWGRRDCDQRRPPNRSYNGNRDNYENYNGGERVREWRPDNRRNNYPGPVNQRGNENYYRGGWDRNNNNDRNRSYRRDNSRNRDDWGSRERTDNTTMYHNNNSSCSEDKNNAPDHLNSQDARLQNLAGPSK